MDKSEVIAQIRAAVDRGITPEAKVCLDTGLSQDLHGRTSVTVADLLSAIAGGEAPAWQLINSAPKSVAEGSTIRGVYLLGFVPADTDIDPQTGVMAIWWEPLTRCTSGKRRGLMGVWFGEGGLEVEPSHWMPLPLAPFAAKTEPASG